MAAELQFRAMGSDGHLIVVGGRHGLVHRTRARVDELERRWSRFLPASEVSELNRRAGHAVAVSPDTIELVERAVDAWHLSGASFDPTVLGDVIRAGYDRSFDELGATPAPGRSFLTTGAADIEIDGNRVRLPAGTGFDPGGIGKGLAADIVVAETLAAGADGVCVNLGGDVRVAGRGPTGDGWTVAVQHPWSPTALAHVGLAAGAVTTSTTLKRRWETDGIVRHHLIDPGTGLPSDSDLNLATVVAAEGWVAEVLAKAVLLRGSTHPFDILGGTAAHGLVVDAEGRIQSTAGFAAYLGAATLPHERVRLTRWGALAAAIAFVLASCGDGTSTRPGQLVAIGGGLQGPAGLKATAFARGLEKASAFAVDGKGRLWVATADYTDQGKDGVYLVAAPGATPTQVITGVHTPLGLLWIGDTLYVASVGRVDTYTGFDGSHFASGRTILTLPSGVGQSNGIVLGSDGRLLMGISAPCDHCTPTSALSATIVSFRPDGTDLQPYATGIRAPIGLLFYPHTNDLFVTMNQRDDLGVRTPGDWLALVRQGQAWGFPSCYGQGGAGSAAVPEPVAVLDKHAAVSGLAIATGELGATVGNATLVAEWATGKVLCVALARTGTMYAGSVHPFLTGLKNAVPLLLTRDGALFVGDWGTGTVYRITA